MALFNRIARLFKADMHAVLDQLEDPVSLLRQSVREMASALADSEREREALEAKCAHLDDKLKQLDARREVLEQELALCFEAKNDALARTLVKRKLEQQQLFVVLNDNCQQLRNQVLASQKRCEQQRVLLESMRQKEEIFIQEESLSPTAEQEIEPFACITPEDIEVALMREKQKRGLS